MISSKTRFSATVRPGTMFSSIRWCTVWMPCLAAASGDSMTTGRPPIFTVPPCPG